MAHNKQYDYDDDLPNDDGLFSTPILCHHNNEVDHCRECDKEMDAMGGIEKCLNCGRIKYGNQLDKDQVCIRPCTNPNEY